MAIIPTLEEVNELLAPLEKRIAELEARENPVEVAACKMDKAKEILFGISTTQVIRLINSGVIKKAVQPTGRVWFFQVAELRELAANPERLNPKQSYR